MSLQGELAGKRVLVVDDLEVNRRLMLMTLDREGCLVDLAANAMDALRILEQNALPDLMLIDLVMPLIDGVSLISIIKEQERYRSIPVVALTAHTETDWIVKAERAGANGFINKPFQIADLIAQVKKYIRRT